MFPIHYLNALGGIVAKETSAADYLLEAIASARQRLNKTYKDAASFEVFDAAGELILHREARDN